MTTYRSRASREAEAAHTILAAHVPDPETGTCPICRTPGPCQPANVAANRLVELGFPVLPPTPEPRPPTLLLRLAPLLTHGWRRRLDPLPPPAGGR
ncbi:hypothetical protein [Plantactinospora sp. B5E13]|uniref:hypothetical protein n=1 Tax=unclassified Plantactinospora TaxID=2631981 RepID=UPI00325D17BC